jgi:hypothetical protein
MPQLPWVDAYVWIALTQRGVPFHYRYFSGVSPMLRELMPDWAPEFTITKAKVVIILLGAFWGNIPSVIDRTALASAILKSEGWTVYVVHEFDVRARGVDTVLNGLTKLRGVTGGPLKQPFGLPDVMAQFRRMRETSRRYISTDVRVRGARSGGGQRVRRPSRAGGFVVVRDYRRPQRERTAGWRRRSRR